MTRYGRPVSIQQKPSTTGHSSRCKLVQISFARVLAALPSCPVWRVIWLFSKGQSYRYTCNPYGLPWAGPAACCASALPAACRALHFWPFRGSFRGFWPASGTFARLPAFAPLLRPFSAFLCCLSQYVLPPAALPLLCLPLRPGLCLPKEVKAARLRAVVCFAASLPALALPGLPGIRTKDKGRPALLCVFAASLKRAAALLRFACAASLCVFQRTSAPSAFVPASDGHGLRPWLH